MTSLHTAFIGRVLGGVSTSLLFSAFESWMVTEHRRRGFPEELLASTFSICSWGNGVVAIVAGFLAQIAADISGDIGPFQLAILLTALSLLLILFWRENYGGDSSESSQSSTGSSILRSCRVIVRHPRILFLGLSQAFFEGAIYTFGTMEYLNSYRLSFIGSSLHVGTHSSAHLPHLSSTHRPRVLCVHAFNDAGRNIVLCGVEYSWRTRGALCRSVWRRCLVYVPSHRL